MTATREQLNHLISRILNLNLENLDGERLQAAIRRTNEELETDALKWINNGCRLLIGPNIVRLIKRFDPNFLGANWKIGEHGENTRALKEFDTSKLKLTSPLLSGEPVLNGEERRKRIMATPETKLGTDAFLFFWENQNQIPESWKNRDAAGNVRHITFDADVLVDPNGNRCVLFLYWQGSCWRWNYDWLAGGFSSRFVSVSLAS